MGSSRAILIGAGVALVVVAVVVAMALLRVPPFSASRGELTAGDVAVALVLPDTIGVSAPRVIDVYERTSAGWSVRSVNPTAAVVVAGTSGSTVADAYSFGGGDGLVSAIAALGMPAPAHWVVVDEATLVKLAGGAPVTLDLPASMEVFDGHRLYSYPAGPSQVSATEFRAVAEGVGFLPPAQGAAVRAQMGDALRSLLTSATPDALRAVRSDVAAESLSPLVTTLRSAQRVAGR